jgi:amino acid adenylation domain-containing protein
MPPPPDLTYADFAAWEREAPGPSDLHASKTYWQLQLRGFPQQVPLPYTSQPSPGLSFVGEIVRIDVPSALVAAIREAASQCETTTRAVLFAGFAAMLFRQSGSRRLLVAVPVARRHRRELEGIIGFFVNTLPLPIEIESGATLFEVARTITRKQLEVSAHEHVPFDQIARGLERAGDVALTNVMFAYHRIGVGLDIFPNLRATCELVHAGGALFDLNLIVQDLDDAFVMWLEYRSDRFDACAIKRMGGHFLNIVRNGIAAPNCSVELLGMLSVREQRYLLNIGTGQASAPFQSVMSLVAAQARQIPDEAAVVDGRGILTYGELMTLVEKGARCLIRSGLRTEQVVAIRTHRSRDTIIAILAVLLAGGTVLLIDLNDPEDRQRFIAEHSRAVRVLEPGCEWMQESSQTDQAVNFPEPARNQLAYLVYTSGSTGRPKGVGIEHGGLSNVICAHIEAYLLRPRMRVLQFFALSLDGAYSEIFGSLGAGATLHVLPAECLSPGRPLLETLETYRINHIGITPSSLALLQHKSLPHLKVIVVAGEACYQELIDRWAEPGRTIINGYGPAEGSIGVTAGVCRRGERKPSLGRPLRGCRVYVLDPRQQLLPVGVPGDICIGGTGVARGYMYQPQLTAERFISDPFSDRKNDRIFRTGDRGRWLSDGQLEFLGRGDACLKIRGFFADPAEIECVLREHSEVAEAAVLFNEQPQGDQRIVAYVTNKGSRSLSAAELRDHCRKTLPRYLIPNNFVCISRMPMLPSGKLDQARLAEVAVGSDQADRYVAPRTSRELRIALAFEEVLRARVGVRDDFFALGGHSLHVAHLGALLERDMNCRLTINDLVVAPTVEQLAARLDRAECGRTELPLVRLTDARAEDVLYLVHPIGGGVGCYIELARGLSPYLSVIGIQADGLETDMEPVNDMAALAGKYLGAIRQNGMPPPRRLGGWSFGGVVAYEMAHQLWQSEEQLVELVLFDSSLGSSYTDALLHDNRSMLIAILREALELAKIRNADGFDSILEAAPSELLERGVVWAERAGVLPQGFGTVALRRRLSVCRANLQALANYRPGHHPSSVTFFEAAERSSRDVPLYRQLPSTITRNWIVESAPGTHESMLGGAGATYIATKLGKLASK